jgi:hypothetical protein
MNPTYCPTCGKVVRISGGGTEMEWNVEGMTKRLRGDLSKSWVCPFCYPERFSAGVSYTMSVDIEKSSAAHVAALKRLAEQTGATKEREAWVEGRHTLLMLDFPTSEAASAFSEGQRLIHGPDIAGGAGA